MLFFILNDIFQGQKVISKVHFCCFFNLNLFINNHSLRSDPKLRQTESTVTFFSQIIFLRHSTGNQLHRLEKNVFVWDSFRLRDTSLITSRGRTTSKLGNNDIMVSDAGSTPPIPNINWLLSIHIRIVRLKDLATLFS